MQNQQTPTVSLSALIIAAATMTKPVKELQQIGESSTPEEAKVIMGTRKELRFPKLFKMKKANLERVFYEVLKTPEFARAFIDTAKAVGKLTDTKQQTQLLGQSVDFRTRAVAQSVANTLQKAISEDQIKLMRYAIMNVVRDEASRYSKDAKSDHPRVITEIVYSKDDEGQTVTKVVPVKDTTGRPKTEMVIGKHADFHVAKGRKDENQVLVDLALDFLDNVLATRTDVTRFDYEDGRDTVLDKKNDSVYANEDTTDLLFADQEKELELVLGVAGFKWIRGENANDTLQALQRALDVLLNDKHWTNAPVEFQLDRLILARQIEERINQITSAKAVAHRYYFGDNSITVGISNSEVKRKNATREFATCIYLTVETVNEGFIEGNTLIYASKYVQGQGYKEVKEDIISSLKTDSDYKEWLAMQDIPADAETYLNVAVR